jgi:hypothetical protein
MAEPDKTVIQLKEIVTIRKFDHTHEDHPTEPVEVVVRESVTEISAEEAALLGFVPQHDAIAIGDTLEIQVEEAGVPVRRIIASDSGSVEGTD